MPSQEDEEESDEESDKQCEDDEDPHEIMAQTQTPIRRNFVSNSAHLRAVFPSLIVPVPVF